MKQACASEFRRVVRFAAKRAVLAALQIDEVMCARREVCSCVRQEFDKIERPVLEIFQDTITAERHAVSHIK